MSNAEDMPGGGSQLVDAVEFAEALGCPVEGIAKLVSAGSVFFVERDGVQLYPTFFADSTLRRRQLRAVVKTLGNWDNFTKWRFFVSGKGSLGGLTPLEALRQGRLLQVMRTAEGFAKR
ncbi:hypothetical protein KAK07_04660 [Ideonella sp. 4Y16]|uniref:hypothetical protein n=1 Tax=Ideonella alba TaxID=2824118 RepID=UPI001B379EEA|nr:hypothetical protein [Ideonella alba]MBQ0942618.1 hypothetical protein [Ideonella alba]